MAKTKNVSKKAVVLVLNTRYCGKAKNKRFPYSTVTMRRSLGAYSASSGYNRTRLLRAQVLRPKYPLKYPSKAPRKQLCRYVVRLNRKPAPKSKAASLRGFLHQRMSTRKYPKCKKGLPCGRTCLPAKLAVHCSAE